MTPTIDSNLSQHYLQIQALTPVSGAEPVTIENSDLQSSTLQQYTSSIVIVFIGMLVVGSIGLLITKTRYINKLVLVLFIAFVTSIIPITMHSLSQQQSVQTQADNDHIPTNVKVTQVTATSFSVLWDTSDYTVGTIRIWDALGNMKYNQIFSEPEGGQIYKHVIVIKDLVPNTSYNFEILSGGEWYNNRGKPLQITTLSR